MHLTSGFKKSCVSALFTIFLMETKYWVTGYYFCSELNLTFTSTNDWQTSDIRKRKEKKTIVWHTSLEVFIILIIRTFNGSSQFRISDI